MTPSEKPYYAVKSLRLLSHLIDLFVLYVAQIVGGHIGSVFVTTIAKWKGIQAPEALTHYAIGGTLFGMLFWGAAIWLINFGILQGMTGSSLGKKVCGLQVCHEDGSPFGITKSILRSMCYIFSTVPFYLGYVMIFWTQKSQCLHDWICGTVVIDKNFRALEDSQKISNINRPFSNKDQDSLDKAA